MDEHEKLVALIRLRDVIYFGVKPTLRQAGVPAAVVQQLAKDQFLRLGDRRSGDDLDRYVVEEILPAGHGFIADHLVHPAAVAGIK